MDKSLYEIPDADRQVLQKHFDRSYYLSSYEDVAKGNIDPLSHFYLIGWREGRNPSRDFDTAYYLQRYPDIAEAGINPFLHYILAGRLEGRTPQRPLDAWRRRLEQSVPTKPAADDPVAPSAQQMGWRELAELLREKTSGKVLIISVSHDDYAVNTGGVQNLIADEQRTCGEIGWHYLHISPVVHRVTLAPHAPANVFQVRLRLGYDAIGAVDMDTLLRALSQLQRRGLRTEVVIHHMMAQAPELLLKLIRSVGVAHPVVWVHDFFTICPSYALLRNDVVFCGGPALGTPACTVCSYGAARQDHVRRIRAFFAQAKPAVLAPSQVALDNWRQIADLEYSCSAALPLARLLLSPSNVRRAAGSAESPFHVAHIGGRSFHKGWPAFEELALALRDDPRYRFFQLGQAQGEPFASCIQQVPVNVTRDTRGAMIEAIAKHRIDIVVSWSFWPETFCFAAYEAVAAGAFVLTQDRAGNVPKMIEQSGPDRGLVLKDRADLLSLFQGADLQRRLANSNRNRGTLLLGSGTIGWLEKQPASADQERADAGANWAEVDAYV